ncbi:glycosyltransferase [Halorubrum yunnanense]|uniref:Glycosyltransferase n=1 Tax=Halorubrum yunnanense TaxID=1526162 RepID=A0ABD5YF13_9EURY|nr:glycosyltransferase family 2 protein [Halorubrum yunnanense]
MKPVDVTLAIPCYNVADVLPETLSAVADLDDSPGRVICIDDGSTDETAEVIRDTPDIELIQHDENRGLAAARNTALEHTETEGLAMIDADVVVDPDWLTHLIEEISTTDAVAVAGCVEERVDTLGDEWRAFYYSSNFGSEPRGEDLGWLIGANVLYDVDALRAVGGWDEQYRTNYEDVDLGERLTDAGYGLRYIPRARGEHNRTDTVPEAIRGKWNWAFRGRNEPHSIGHLFRRLPFHAGIGARDTFLAVKDLRLRLLPITLVYPLFWIYYDLESYFGG